MIALSNTAHLYARPDTKTELVEFFTAVLGAKGRTVTRDYVHGPPEPMYAFEFSNGAVLSVEFTEDALDDQRARRAAWLELGPTIRSACSGGSKNWG